MVCSKGSPESNALVRALDWAVIFEGHQLEPWCGHSKFEGGQLFFEG